MAEGQGPTLKGPQLKQELERLHIDLELQTKEQIHDNLSDKNRGRTTLPKNQMENEMSQSDPTPFASALPGDRYESSVLRAADSMDAAAKRLEAIGARFAPPSTAKTVALIGGAAVGSVGVLVLSGVIVHWITKPATPKLAMK